MFHTQKIATNHPELNLLHDGEPKLSYKNVSGLIQFKVLYHLNTSGVYHQFAFKDRILWGDKYNRFIHQSICHQSLHYSTVNYILRSLESWHTVLYDLVQYGRIHY